MFRASYDKFNRDTVEIWESSCIAQMWFGWINVQYLGVWEKFFSVNVSEKCYQQKFDYNTLKVENQ